VREQRRGRKIAMSTDELYEFLAVERTCRLATISRGGPHVVPLWFHWDGAAMWFTSIVASQRWADLQRDPRVSVVVDAGAGFGDLRGVELTGRVTQIGEAPRVGEPNPDLIEVERRFSIKYAGREEMHHDGRHAWLRLDPDKIVSWDFRKIGS
jgi:Pyridoxamine 5'-phosphate oxidase